ncbi:DUF397 domain-containing protein [Streptomyces sp. McG3]|nr:DUF397 domain-containing protein [Streptomyces sp. McG3]
MRQREPYGDLAGRPIGASDRVSHCIEVAGGHPGLIPVRDGKVPVGPVLLVRQSPARAPAHARAAVTSCVAIVGQPHSCSALWIDAARSAGRSAGATKARPRQSSVRPGRISLRVRTRSAVEVPDAAGAGVLPCGGAGIRRIAANGSARSVRARSSSRTSACAWSMGSPEASISRGSRAAPRRSISRP